MNFQTKEALLNFIDEFVKSEKKHFPVQTDIVELCSGSEMERLVIEIENDLDSLLAENRILLQNLRLDDAVKSFQFTLRACLASNKQLQEFKDLLLENSGVELFENELSLADKDPKKLVASKIDYKSAQEIEKLLKSRSDTYDFTYAENTTFLHHKRAFVLALIIIDDQFRKARNPAEEISNDYSFLEDFFNAKGTDLEQHDQFSRYKLLTLGEDIELLECFPARIYHKKADATLFLNGIEDYLFEYLMKLIKENDLQLSLKTSTLFVVDGRNDFGGLYEHLETGRYFEIENFKGKLLTKLYDDSYDNLWVKIEGNDLTFEEIIQDVDIYGDMIVTQVVHSQYILENDNLYITHLDHEFIFYTLEEFEDRATDPNQKGAARPRVKTFKIDDSKILVNEQENILYDVLQMKFTNKELIKEYFAKVQ